jgi:ATP-dependent exoDNAse (exonuclease V) alpha subunit
VANIAQTAATEALAGLVERVTFHNPENGFCVLRVKARGQRDLITVVGHAAMISAGEFVQMSGAWVNDRTHGQQFRASFLKASPPTTLEGIERYLASGMIRGIGPVYAKRLVRGFGEAVFDLIEQQPERLREVAGIGAKRAARIIAGWAEQKIIREIMLFLHANGVGTSRAVRIYKTYGNDAVRVENTSVAGWDDHTVFDQRIRNYTKKPIDVEVRRTYAGHVVFRSVLEPKLHDFQTVQFQKRVPAGEKADLMYELVEHKGYNEKQHNVTLEQAEIQR